MAKTDKNQRATSPAGLKDKLEFPGNKGWGGTSKQTRTPSGITVMFEEDSDAILKFIGVVDISDKCGKPPGEALKYTFWDGKCLISLPAGYALKETIFQPGSWYYVWVSGMIANKTPGFNPMKDFDIRELGIDGEEIQCPQRVSENLILLLEEKQIAEINYTRLNYPLRKK